MLRKILLALMLMVPGLAWGQAVTLPAYQATSGSAIPTSAASPLPVRVYGGTNGQCLVSNGTFGVYNTCGGGSGGFNINLGLGLTTSPGTNNATPLSSTNTNLYPQTFALILTTTQTITASEASAVNVLNSTTSTAWVLPMAGTTGFAQGTAYNFLNINTGALNITTSGSLFQGMPLVGSTLTLSQYGYATCVSDGSSNWDCSGTTGGASSSSNLGSSASAVNPGITGDVTTGFFTAGAAKIDAAISGTKMLELTTTTGILNLTNAGGAYQIGAANALSYPTTDSTASGATIAIGASALSGLTTSAAYNAVAVGYQAMGAGNILPTAIQNIAIGYQALKAVTSGNGDTIIGDQAGLADTSGTGNTLIGSGAGLDITSGSFNIAIGSNALDRNNTGSNNTVIGINALVNNFGSASTTSNTTVLGYQAGFKSAGSSNTVIGASVGSTNLGSGSGNILIGTSATTDLYFGDATHSINIGGNKSDRNDTVVGFGAGGNYIFGATTTTANTSIGYKALAAMTTGAVNSVAVGANAGLLITTGATNTIIGANVGSTTLTTGSSNILIGTSSAVTTAASSSNNEINIGGILFYNSVSTAAPAVSACGTSPSIDAHANNKSGTVTVGTVAAASCTVTFAGGGYTTWSHCRVTPQTALATFGYTYTTTVLTVTATSLLTEVFDYDCDGY